MKLSILMLAIICPFFSMCQPIVIKGKVIDEDGTPVLTATISIKGTNRGTITDKFGFFLLEGTKINDTLIVSASGYETKEEPNNERGQVTIILKRKVTKLEEVILHSGYQTLSRERATGSFSKIDNELINRSTSTGILERLQTLAPGLLFDKNTGSDAGVSIRGISTIFASSTPLIVVDNFPYDGDIQNINPNDVESVTLLKDAAAASIWGAAAGNGVIVITTKSGRYAKPLRINVSSNFTNIDKPDFFYYPRMSSTDFIDLEKYLFAQGFYNSTISNTTNRPVLSPVVEILAKQRSGQLTQFQADSLINPLRLLDSRLDFDKYFYRNGTRGQYAISLEGGSANNNYFLSVGIDRNKETLVGNSYSRYTVTAKNNFRPWNKVQILSSIVFVQSEDAHANNGGTAISPGAGKGNLYPYAQLGDQFNNPLAVVKDYRSAYIDTAGRGLLLDWKYRPLEELNLTDKSTKLLNMTMNAGIRYEVLKFLSIEARYQFTRETRTNRQYYDPASYMVRNLINRYSQINGSIVKYIIPKGGILDMLQGGTTSHSGRLQLNFNRNWTQVHQLTAIAGAEIREVNSTSNDSRSYGYNDEFLTVYNIDFADLYPIYGNLSSASRIPNLLSYSDLLNRYVSLFANASYTLHSKYVVSASVRKDASNLFGVKTNQKGVPLWSSGVAWNLDKESFYKLKVLPVCRLRVTYGYSGNIDNGRSAYPTMEYSNAPDALTNLPFAFIVNPSNPLLRWEKVGMFNAGIDFGFINNRINGSLEYYKKNAKDLFSNIQVDNTTGFSTLIVNSANIKGQGVEFQLNTINTKGKVQWETSFLFTYSENKITEYSNSGITARSYIGNGITLNPVVGKHAYALYSYYSAGLDGVGDPQGILAGQISKNYSALRNDSITSQKYHGSAAPLFYGAIRNTILWHGFSASINIGFKTNYFFRRPTVNYTGVANAWTTHSDYALRWQKPGDELTTNVPSFIYPIVTARDEFYGFTETTVERADHIRLQDIRLAYTWTPSKGKDEVLKSLQAFLFINTQTILWRANKHHLDPDHLRDDLPAPLAVSVGLRVEL